MASKKAKRVQKVKKYFIEVRLRGLLGTLVT